MVSLLEMTQPAGGALNCSRTPAGSVLIAWAITRLPRIRERIQFCGRLPSRKIVFQMAEGAVLGELFRTILTAIDRLRPPVPASG